MMGIMFVWNLLLGIVAGVSYIQEIEARIKFGITFLLWVIGVVSTVMIYGNYAFQNPHLAIQLAPSVLTSLFISTISFVFGLVAGAGILTVTQE